MEPFIGEITIGGFTFAPRGWAFCNGATLPILQNQALFSLIGAYFGGDGKTQFQLPNLCGRTPVGCYSPTSMPPNGLTQYALGTSLGAESVTLLSSQMPTHTHAVNADNTASTKGIAGNIPGAVVDQKTLAPVNAFAVPTDGSQVTLTNQVGTAGTSSPHSNMQPFSVINFIIATSGVYPTRD